MNLSDVSHDDLIAEVQRRLSLGYFGYHGLYSDNQRDAIARAHAFRDWLMAEVENYRLSTSGFGEGLRMVLGHISQSEPAPVPEFKVYAVNTTRYDRPLDEITESGFGRAA